MQDQLTRIRILLEQISGQSETPETLELLKQIQAQIAILQIENPPQYQFPLKEYQAFKWEKIEAKPQLSDEFGVTVILWHGIAFRRYVTHPSRRPRMLWFSHFLGRTKDDQNIFHRLITFVGET